MAEIPDPQVVRDRIEDGDAARAFARTHELTAEWMHEMSKRLFVELERQMKAVEDAVRSSNSETRRENADTLASLERTMGRIARTSHGRAVLIGGRYRID